VLDHRGRIRDKYFARYPEQFPLKHVNDLKKVPGASNGAGGKFAGASLAEITKVASRHETGSESFGIPNKLG
jgi:hypothetical protein